MKMNGKNKESDDRQITRKEVREWRSLESGQNQAHDLPGVVYSQLVAL